MSSNAFGTAYLSTGEVDITDRFIFDNGQRNTYYDVGTIKIKPDAAKPTGPIRITFDYFTHGAGDYFSVESYNGIAYDDIPSFQHYSQRKQKHIPCQISYLQQVTKMFLGLWILQW